MAENPNEASQRWQIFLSHLASSFKEVTLVGPFAAAREEWPVPSIFVDRGSLHKTDDPLHFSIGDGDSAPLALDYTLPRDKDLSDLAFVLSHLPQNISRVSMVGFLGGRRDHELINLGEVHRFLSNRTSAAECDLDWSVCAFSAGQWYLDFKGIFSLVCFESCMVELIGSCQFQLLEPTKIEAVSSHGLSNQAHGALSLKCSRPVFIFKNPFS